MKPFTFQQYLTEKCSFSALSEQIYFFVPEDSDLFYNPVDLAKASHLVKNVNPIGLIYHTVLNESLFYAQSILLRFPSLWLDFGFNELKELVEGCECDINLMERVIEFFSKSFEIEFSLLFDLMDLCSNYSENSRRRLEYANRASSFFDHDFLNECRISLEKVAFVRDRILEQRHN